MRKKLTYGLLAFILIIGIGGWLLTRPDIARLTTAQQSGRVPTLGEVREEAFPTIYVARVRHRALPRVSVLSVLLKGSIIPAI
jgi:hypothetical protein